ncbi:hypothetical protein ELH38_04245 [Rhizobium ruizarguesonis]|nr:hypothetical protein ELH38_04245 [Rhizobium ruizarguesonis]
MILHSDFERGSPLPPKRVAHHVLVSNSSMTTGAPALGAQAPVVCQAAAWVSGASAPGSWRRRGRSDDASGR